MEGINHDLETPKKSFFKRKNLSLVVFAGLIAISLLTVSLVKQSQDIRQQAQVTTASPCQFQKADQPLNVAFCETFDVPKGNGGRSGDLDPILWGVSRIGGDNNVTQGQTNGFGTAHLVGCGTTQAVQTPKDVQICNGHVYEAVNDEGSQTTLAMYPKQPFDISGGRTGTVTFDLTADSEGEHAAWPEFWWTDQPVPAPHGDISAQTPHPRNGFGLIFTGCDGVTETGLRKIQISRNYVIEEPNINGGSCIKKGDAATAKFNHFELRINTNHFELWGSDAGTNTLKLMGSGDNLNLPLTKGLVWMEDLHYNAGKFNNQGDHTFAWDNVGFDGPFTYRDLAYDVPIESASVQGWGLPLSKMTDPVSWVQTPTSAILVFNWWPWESFVPDVRVNGNAWHSTSWQGGFSTFAWDTIAVPIPLSEVIQGQNKVEFRSNDGNTMVANIDLIMVAGAPVPGTTITPTSPTPTNTPVPTTNVPTNTPTPTPTGTATQSDLSLSPATQSVTNGNTFPVQIRVNTNGQMVNAIQANISYPSNLLDIVSVSNSGGAFEVEAEKTLGTGTTRLAYGTTTPKSGNLLIATITFSAKAAGSATVSFVNGTTVVSSTTNTNVMRSATGGTYTITNIVPTSTPTPVPGKVGDLNKDGFVNLTDLSIILSNWSTTNAVADINKDGTVGLTDLSMLLSNWGL